jgi:inhibitor of cysteine peptidase
MRLLAVLALLALTLAACGGGDNDDSESSGEAIKLAEVDSGGAREVAVGEEIDIVLPSNPTTGYSWNPLQQPDAAVVAFVDQDYEPSSSDAVGSGGMETLTYRAVGAGETTIDLGYFQPWEPDNVDKTFTITIKASM